MFVKIMFCLVCTNTNQYYFNVKDSIFKKPIVLINWRAFITYLLALRSAVYLRLYFLLLILLLETNNWVIFD
jgi:hypothetical protein